MIDFHKVTKFLKTVNKTENYDGAAILSFYFLLSIFPAILIFLKLSSFVYYNTEQTDIAIEWYSRIPGNLREIFVEIVTEIKKSKNSGIWSVTYLAALWTVMNGVSAISRQLNRINNFTETQSFFKLKIRALKISILFILLLFGTSLTTFLSSYVINFLENVIHIGVLQKYLLLLIKYSILLLIPFSFFVTIYRLGSNSKTKINSVIPGSIFSSISFITFTHLFSSYLKNFANYSATYGSIGAVIGLVTWLYFTGFILISGALLNKVSLLDK